MHEGKEHMFLPFASGMKVWGTRNTEYLNVCLSLFSDISMVITAFSNLNVHWICSSGFWRTTTIMANYFNGLKGINMYSAYRYTRRKIQFKSVSRWWFQLLSMVTPIDWRFPFWLHSIFQLGWNHLCLHIPWESKDCYIDCLLGKIIVFAGVCAQQFQDTFLLKVLDFKGIFLITPGFTMFHQRFPGAPFWLSYTHRIHVWYICLHLP